MNIFELLVLRGNEPSDDDVSFVLCVCACVLACLPACLLAWREGERGVRGEAGRAVCGSCFGFVGTLSSRASIDFLPRVFFVVPV